MMNGKQKQNYESPIETFGDDKLRVVESLT